jgi:tRNA pseudouridine13 synthase
VPALWFSAALDIPLAHGPAPVSGKLRVSPEDFVVEEDLGFAPDGEGSHFLIRLRKRGANTDWVASALARAAQVRFGDVGFAGMKDRNAVATQWFSVPAGRTRPDHWRRLAIPGVEILEVHPHRRKLRRGALEGNRFRVRIRDVDGGAAALHSRIVSVRGLGVPNYFGPQRFGRDGNNLRSAWDWAHGGPPPRSHGTRSIVLSAGRSVIFNAVLADRVRRRTWDYLENGDVANLEGSGSVFPVADVTEELRRRVARFDIHPTGPLWGAGLSLSEGAVRLRETEIAQQFIPLPQFLTQAGLRHERRALRLQVKDLEVIVKGHMLELSFSLPAGAFATAVLREIADTGQGESGD